MSPAADVDHRYAARSPRELLDQLRQRLGQLPDNHPSSPRFGWYGADPSGWDVIWQEPAREESAEWESPEWESPESESGVLDPVGLGSDEPEPGQPGSDDPWPGAGDGEQAAADWARFLPFDILGGELLPGSLGEAETYRPWFMSGEALPPWFAAPGSG